MSRGSSSGGSAFGVLVLLGIVLWIVSLILRYIGPILGLLAIAASIYGARALLRDNLRRKEEYDEYCAQVAATADKQNDWVRQGDMRSLRVQEVSTARGMITDRSGRPLAVSVPSR